MPAVNDKSAWTARSSIEGSRLKITRSGAKMTGGTYTIQELFHIKFRLDDSLAPNVKKIFTRLASTYSPVTSVVDVARGTAFPQLLTASSQASSKTTPSHAQTPCRIVKKPKVKRSIFKKPAGHQ